MNKDIDQQLQNFISTLSTKHDIVDWGYCTEDRPLSYQRYIKWLEQGNHSNLTYMAGERAKIRESIKVFYPEFKSAIVFLFSYATVAKFLQEFYGEKKSNGLRVASFVLGFGGIDYHHYLKDKLQLIGQEICQQSGGNFVMGLDVHPVLERDLAVRSGLGWFGKNSMFISPSAGSFLIIGSLFFNKLLPLSSADITTDHCGTCNACITACPTNAILDNRTLDAAKCISNFTIEQFKESPPPRGMEFARGEIFGCDICQDVCPWNKTYLKKLVTTELQWQEFFHSLLEDDVELLIEKFSQMSNRQYRRLFKATSLERTGRRGILKNLRFWQTIRIKS